MTDQNGDRLDFVLGDYERRKQDETRRMVERALRLEQVRKTGAEQLRNFAVEEAREVTRRLRESGHRVTHQELLDAYPPNIRIHLWPKAGPLDEEQTARHTIELVWGEPDADSLCARCWAADGLDRMKHQGSARPGVLDSTWVREQLLVFVRDTLDSV